MDSLFYECNCLTSINLLNFKTSKVINMANMFYGCYFLEFLNLSNFDTSNVISMLNMFSFCFALTSLDLSNFNTSQVTNMESMFFGCSSLEYINMKNFDESKLTSYEYIFDDLPNKVIICVNENGYNKIISELENIECCIIDCSENWRLKLEIIKENQDCTKSFELQTQSENDYKENDNDKITNKYIISEIYSTMKINECEALDKCLYCPNEALKLNLCLLCNNGFYPKENDDSNTGGYIDCYKDIEGYYLDTNDSLFKKCFYSCEACETGGDNITHNCLKCNINYQFEINLTKYKNCYEKCEYYYYFDSENQYHCSMNFSCPKEFPKLLEDKSQCVSDDINKNESNYNYEENIQEFLFFSYLFKSNNSESNKINIDNPSNDIEEKYQILSDSIESNKSNSGINDINEYIDHLSSEIIDSHQSYNRSNDINKYISVNNITEKYQPSFEVIKSEKNQYLSDINYATINIEKKNQNNTANNDITESIEKIKALINNQKNETKEELEIKYYDLLFETIESIITGENFDTSLLDNGEDSMIDLGKVIITLTTTKNQDNSINNNKTVIYLKECETLLREYYNISDEKILYIKKIDVIQEKMKIPKIEFDIYSKLFETNLTKLNLSICEKNKIYISIPLEINENINILNSSSEYYKDKCYKSTSEHGTDIIINDRKKEFVEGNKTVCQEDCIFYEYSHNVKKVNCSCQIKQFNITYKDMNINQTKLYENFDNNNKKDISNIYLTSCNVLSSKDNIESNTGFYLLLFIIIAFIIVFITFYTKGYNMLEDRIDEVIYKKFKKETKHPKTKVENKILNNIIKPSKKKKTKRKLRLNSSTKSNTTNNLFLNKSQINKAKNHEEENIKVDTDYEINWLSYNEAIRLDKRSSCEYYCSLIKNKQLFIFTFCTFNDYNSGVIKKFMLFLSFALHYTINALFFDDSNMHQIYEDKGKYNFEYQFPYIIISSLISIAILRLMLQILVLTDKDVLEVKHQINKEKAINMKQKKLKNMKIKFAIFFILNFILLVLFWYYLTCFNAIYENTQIYLIENTFISFSFSLCYPFIINIIPMIIRNYSIHSSKKNKSYFYRLSQIFQLF